MRCMNEFPISFSLRTVKGQNGASFLLTGSEPLLLGMTMLMASLPFLPLVGPLLPPTITNHNHLINSASSQGLFVNNANGNVSHLYCTNPIFICIYIRIMEALSGNSIQNTTQVNPVSACAAIAQSLKTRLPTRLRGILSKVSPTRRDPQSRRLLVRFPNCIVYCIPK